MKNNSNKKVDAYLSKLDRLPHMTNDYKYVKGSAVVNNYNNEITVVSITAYHKVSHNKIEAIEVISTSDFNETNS